MLRVTKGQSMPSNQRFEKSIECPTNESLLAFLHDDRGELTAEEARLVEHLTACEFCELTLELLRAHPAQSVPDPSLAPPVPEQIVRLWPTRRVHK
jgi:hypothetical protein